jgi:integrase
MTAAKAHNIRADRARKRELPNKERRATAEAARRAEDARPTIARLWALYDNSKPDRASRSGDTYRYSRHLAPFFADKTPAELVTLDVERLRVKLSKTHKPQTVKHVLALLKRVVNHGAKTGRCPMPDSSRLHFAFPKVDNEKTENLTREQMAAYLKALDEEPDQNAAAFMRLALFAGMRKGALMALQWKDVDFERGFITLQGEYAKNQKTKSIPLSHLARTVLEKVERMGSPYVFPGRGGGKRTDFKRIALRVRDRAGLPKDFRPLHGLRHTFASWAASTRAVDLYTLQKMLTHKSVQMTQRYAHLADEALQGAAKVTGDMFQGVTAEGATALSFTRKKRH